jgi:hypothetical protein
MSEICALGLIAPASFPPAKSLSALLLPRMPRLRALSVYAGDCCNVELSWYWFGAGCSTWQHAFQKKRKNKKILQSV